jgi:hypothetical protein
LFVPGQHKKFQFSNYESKRTKFKEAIHFFDVRHREVLFNCIALGISQPSAMFFKSLASFTTGIIDRAKLDIGRWRCVHLCLR